MRNLLVLSDSASLFDSVEVARTLSPEGGNGSELIEVPFISVTVDYGREQILLLTSNGIVHRTSTDSLAEAEGLCVLDCSAAAATAEEGIERQAEDWFNIEYVDEISSLVCISRAGAICTLGTNLSHILFAISPAILYLNVSCFIGEDQGCEQEGVIEGGIAAAQWAPDGASVLIATNNDSLITMTRFQKLCVCPRLIGFHLISYTLYYKRSTWDVLNEVPIEPKVKGSAVRISWRGDGEYVAVFSHDRYLVFALSLNIVSFASS